MSTETEAGVSTKLFVGFLLNSELRMHLNQSKTYKQEKIGSQSDFIEIHYQDKDYFGHFLDKSLITLKELKKMDSEMRKKLELYCPAFDTDHATFVVLTQVFVK